MSDAPVRIALWSGPRNISTAMMRSWGQRPDTIVCDEPLYAHYLARTGVAHPGADEVVRHHEADWRRVADWLTGPLPPGKRVFYQKHMSHHLLPEIERDWLAGLRHGFLIRDPREMLTSLVKVYPEATLADTGLPQQVELFDWVRERTAATPPVVDARDVLEHPRATLSRLCEAFGLEFEEAMLSWPPGRRETDGIWAKHWYAAVERSTSFERYRPKAERVPPELDGLLERCIALYDRLRAHRIEP